MNATTPIAISTTDVSVLAWFSSHQDLKRVAERLSELRLEELPVRE